MSSSDDEGSEAESVASDSEESNQNLFSGDKMNVSRLELDSDAEMPYEQLPRKRYTSWSDEGETRTKKIKGLPIKLPDGTIRKSAKVLVMSDLEQSSDESEEEALLRKPETNVEDITTGARFGRAAIADVITKSSKSERVEAAKEQIASICQEILAEPENSVRKFCLLLPGLKL